MPADRKIGGHPLSFMIPKFLRHLLVFRDYPVPWIQFIDSKGIPDFRINDQAKVLHVLQCRLCGLCGRALKRRIAFIGGELSCESRMFLDPGMHPRCAQFAAAVCPYLARSDRHHNTVKSIDKGEGTRTDECPLVDAERRPKRMGILYTNSYSVVRRPGDPHTYIMAGLVQHIDYSVMPPGEDHAG